MLIFFVAVVSVIAGAVLLGLGVFFYVLLKAINRMSVATEAMAKILEPMMQGDQVSGALSTVRKMGGKIGEVVSALHAHMAVMREFNKMILAPEVHAQYEQKTAEQAPEPDSFYKAPTDEEMAAEEIKQQAREVGIEVDSDSITNIPDVSGMRGTSV